MKFLKRWFRSLVVEYVILDVHPAPVHLDSVAVANNLISALRVAVEDTTKEAIARHSSIALKALADVVPVVNVPAPVVNLPEPVVNLDPKAVAGEIVSSLESGLYDRLERVVIASLKPRLPEQPQLEPPQNPTTESRLLSMLPPDIQKAARFGCRRVQNESHYPAGGSRLGNNWHRDEACEQAIMWLNERVLSYHYTDVSLGCELYYRIYVRGNE